MQYTRLGQTGLVVSKLSLGAMTFGEPNPLFAEVAKVRQPQADALVARAMDAGVNFFNTADMYSFGESEQMLGHALGGRRHQAVIATKAGVRMSANLLDQGLSRRHLLASVEGSLKRLGTDYLDVFLVHRVDPVTPLQETLEALDQLVRAGKVRYLGFSNWPAWMAAKALGLQERHGWARFCAAEMYYSLVGREVEHEILPFALDAGIGIMPWSPLGSGFLSGKYTRENPAGDGGRIAKRDYVPIDRERGWQILDTVKRVAQHHGVTAAAVSLAWLLGRPAVASVLVGATTLDQLDSNLQSAGLTLTPEQRQELDEVSAIQSVYPGWFVGNDIDAMTEQALSGPATDAP